MDQAEREQREQDRDDLRRLKSMPAWERYFVRRINEEIQSQKDALVPRQTEMETERRRAKIETLHGISQFFDNEESRLTMDNPEDGN